MEEAKVVQERKKRVLVVAVDFDGCLGHTVFTENYKRMLKELPKDCTAEQRETAFKDVIRRSNAALVEDIARRSQDYDQVVVIVGSNRQSANKDQHDAQKNKNGSCFEATHMLGKVLKEQTQKPVQLDKYLVFDSILGLHAGTNFDLKEQEQTAIFGDYTTSIDLKYRLAYFQMQRVCAYYPDADVSYVHYDDRDDIVKDTARHFQSEQGLHFPPNMVEATACQYELYNPNTDLISLAEKARKQAEKDPDSLVDQSDIDRFNTILDIISQKAQALERIIPNHQDEIRKIQNQKNDLLREREDLPNQEGEEYRKITQQINNLERHLNEIKKTTAIKKNIEELRRTLREQCGDDLSNPQLKWSQFNSILKAADKLNNNNIQTKYLDVFPELQREYQGSLAANENETVREMGQFQRTDREGHQIDPAIFDRTVQECMNDNVVDRTRSYELLFKEESIIKKVIDIENKINDGTFKAEMIDNLDAAQRYRLLEPLKKVFIEGKIDSRIMDSAIEKFGLSQKVRQEYLDKWNLEKRLYSDNQKIDAWIAEFDQALNTQTFDANSLDSILGENGIELDQTKTNRILVPIEKAFMQGKLSFNALKACHERMYHDPHDRLKALEALYDKVAANDNTLYSPPKNPLIRFLKGIVGKENFSSERLDHIAKIQQEYIKIVKENKDDPKVKEHLAASTLPDYETRHAYIGINHATGCRKKLMYLYRDDPGMTLQQLFRLSTESNNPFKAEGAGGFIATALLGAKRRLASFKTEQIADYIGKHPQHAPQLLAAYKDDLARNPQTIYGILNNPELHAAVKESKLLESKYLSQEDKKKLSEFMALKASQSAPTSPEGRPPVPTISVAELKRENRPAPPSYPAPPIPTNEKRPPLSKTTVSEGIRKDRPAPPPYNAPPIPSSSTAAKDASSQLSTTREPSDEEIEEAMKVLERAESSPRSDKAKKPSDTHSPPSKEEIEAVSNALENAGRPDWTEKPAPKKSEERTPDSTTSSDTESFEGPKNE